MQTQENRLILYITLVLLGIMILSVLFAFIFPGNAELNPHFDKPRQENGYIEGKIFNVSKANMYYVRLTTFLSDGFYIITEAPVDEYGLWEMKLPSVGDYLILQIVDKAYSFIPNEFRVYDTMGIPTESQKIHENI